MDSVQVEETPISSRSRRNPVPMCDVDDLAFRNRHDPNFIAEITNIMQVPSTITVVNGIGENQTNLRGFKPTKELFSMEIPDTLTADNLITERVVTNGYMNSIEENQELFNANNAENFNTFLNTTGSQTPIANKTVLGRSIFEEGQIAKTPQISEELFKRMRPRRSSLEVDLNSEIRQLRDKINRLEHECQINTQTNRVFYVILFGYALVKTFSWLLKK